MTRTSSRRRGLSVALPLVVVLAGCGQGAGAEGTASETVDPGPARSGAVFAGAAASCVEEYDLQTLTGRAFAFDGTVTAIERSEADESGDDLGYAAVAFEVHEWFRGGSPEQVTVALPAPDQVSSAGGVSGQDGAAYAVGTRLLVSGEPQWGGEPLEEPIGWMCGFTRYHDEQTATRWRTALEP